MWFLVFYETILKLLSTLQPGAWFTSFSQTRTSDSTDWEGYCLVQRIEADRLHLSGNTVMLTLRGAEDTDVNAYIDRVYISRAAAVGEPYASASDFASEGETNPKRLKELALAALPRTLTP